MVVVVVRVGVVVVRVAGGVWVGGARPCPVPVVGSAAADVLLLLVLLLVLVVVVLLLLRLLLLLLLLLKDTRDGPPGCGDLKAGAVLTSGTRACCACMRRLPGLKITKN